MRYFTNEEYSEMVYTLDFFKNMLIDDDLEKLELEEMKRDIGGEMWCEEIGDFVGKYDCGFICDKYKPCNGKSGRCRNLKNGFVETGRDFLLTKNGLREITNVP